MNDDTLLAEPVADRRKLAQARPSRQVHPKQRTN